MEAQRLGVPLEELHWRSLGPNLGQGVGVCGQVGNLPFLDRVPSVSPVDTGVGGAEGVEGTPAAWLFRLEKGA